MLLWIPDRLTTTKHGNTQRRAETLWWLYLTLCAPLAKCFERSHRYPIINRLIRSSSAGGSANTSSHPKRHKVHKEHCDIHIIINAWCASQITASDAALQRSGRGETGSWVYWHVDDIRRLNYWRRLEDKRHGWHVNEESCMKEITISRAIYQEKLYANGDISSSHWISEHFTALRIHCGG